jgi:hypothetical protein
LLSAGILFGASSEGPGGSEKGLVKNLSADVKTIEEVLRRHTDRLMQIPGVVAIALGICNERPCIKVYVRDMTPALQAAIPTVLDGYPVCLEPSGEIRALP